MKAIKIKQAKRRVARRLIFILTSTFIAGIVLGSVACGIVLIGMRII